MLMKDAMKAMSNGEFLFNAFTILNTNGDLFRHAPSPNKKLEEIAADVSSDVMIIEDHSSICHDFTWEARMFHFERDNEGKRVKKSNTATVHELGNRVWINATSLKEGYSGGAKLYHIVSTYAYNNGKVFIGDPAGLSPIAHYRRLENMIMSSIRFRTTDHLKPHPKQIKGLNVGGWKLNGLEWADGDSHLNTENMMKLSDSYIRKAAPDINDVVYDFEQGVFYDQTCISTTDGAGTPIIAEIQWKEIAAKRRVRANGIGCNTLKRAVVTHTLLQEARRDSWNGVLEKLARFAGTRGLRVRKLFL